MVSNGFQIIGPNDGVGPHVDGNCVLKSDWANAYICENPKLAHLFFESLDSDRTSRMLSPIHYKGASQKLLE